MQRNPHTPNFTERTSLLRPRSTTPTSNPPGKHGLYLLRESKAGLQEVIVLIQLSLPVIAAYLLQNSFQTVSMMLVGRFYPESLSVAAFSYMFSTCTGWLIGMGGSTALDTLASTAFTGCDKHYTGILLQRAAIVLTLFYIPIAVIWVYAEPLFIALGQDKSLSHESARFLTHLIPGGLGYIYFEILKKYLQAQGIVQPATYILLITSPISAGLNYLLIQFSDFGVMGAPLATGIGYWLSFLALLAYARFARGYECWGGWDRRCLENLPAFARLAFLGFVHLGTEFWAFEIVALVAGRLGPLPLASQSVLMTADQVLVTTPFGIGVATSIRVGGLLGLRDRTAAIRSVRAAIFLTSGVATSVMIVLIASRSRFAAIFTPDGTVISYTARVLPWVAFFQIFDGLNGSCGGSLRGIGKQNLGATINALSYYIVALPLGTWMAFSGWELSGLWIGQTVGMILVAGLELVVILSVNWDDEIDKAFQRIVA
ncbi:MatE family transporter [Colletotrichum fioriniae PJ7]|uniref:MatE family transporter n=1 Tax=Colletotrichum fioriniae PJ7 TaxID=1445577 RepID=A0A010R5U2_9PEZI|nr:MatE family transporter [Colletotrichum fioriniae PJ7]